MDPSDGGKDLSLDPSAGKAPGPVPAPPPKAGVGDPGASVEDVPTKPVAVPKGIPKIIGHPLKLSLAEIY